MSSGSIFVAGVELAEFSYQSNLRVVLLCLIKFDNIFIVLSYVLPYPLSACILVATGLRVNAVYVKVDSGPGVDKFLSFKSVFESLI